jgi:hypothetical protein
MDRKEIIKAANEWLDADIQQRASFCIIGERGSDGLLRLSVSGGGDSNILCSAMIEQMRRTSGIYDILQTAVNEYRRLYHQPAVLN